MKCLNKIAFGLVGAAMLTGCGYLIDLNPKMKLTSDNFYHTESDAFQALTSAYGPLRISAPVSASGSPQNCAFEVISEVMGDCCYAGGANSTDLVALQRTSNFKMYTNDPSAEALWFKYYMGINRCNQFLLHINDCAFANEDLRARYKAEIYFLRAYYYFDLVRLFGNVPLVLKVLTTADNPPQATPEDVYTQIANDLLAAINAKGADGTTVLLPRSSLDLAGSDKGRATIAAAKSLLARVWLYYTGYYSQAQLPGVTLPQIAQMVEDVITGSGNTLMPNAWDRTNVITGTKLGVTPLFDVTNKNGVEGVFEIQYSALSKWGDWSNRDGCTGNQAVILWGIRDLGAPYAAGWSFAPVDKKLFDAYSATDSRRLATLINANTSTIAGDDGEGLKYTAGYQNTGYFCRKFTPLARNNASAGSRELNYPNDYMSIRFADVLLMGAELQLKSGNSSLAFDHYKAVRERALGAGSAGTAAQLTMDKIFTERYLELALEGQRYWDILRQGQDVAVAKLTNGETGDFAVTYDRAKAGLMPIPQYEIIQSGYTLKQNPGY